MKNNLNEEILRQLSLIKFDRSKTMLEHNEIVESNYIFEQSVIGLGNKNIGGTKDTDSTLLCKNKLGGDFKWSLMRHWLDSDANNKVYDNKTNYDCFYDMFWSKQTPEKRANYIFNNIKNNFGVTGSNDEIFYLLKLIEVGPRYFQENTYRELLKKVLTLGSYKGPIPSILKFVLKSGKTDLKYRSVIDWIQMNGYGPEYIYMEEKQERYLKKFTKILSNYGDDSEKMWIRFDGVSKQEELDKYNKEIEKGYEERLQKNQQFPGEEYSYFGKQKTTAATVAELHLILPLADLILSLFGGLPGVVAGSILSLIDASIYYVYDDDPYMAGISAILSLVGLGTLRAVPGFAELTKPGVRKAFTEMGKKLKNGENLSAAERVFLKNLAKNEVVMGDVILRMTQKKLVEVYKSQGGKGVYKFLNWMSEKGWLAATGHNFIANMILGTIGFDYYAYKKWGKCSGSFQLASIYRMINELIDEEGDIEKWNPNTLKNKITKILDFSQPFTSSKEECEGLAKWQIYKTIIKNRKNLLNKVYLTTLNTAQGMLKTGEFYSNKTKRYSNNIHKIQNFLLNCNDEGKITLLKTPTQNKEVIKVVYHPITNTLEINNSSGIKSLEIVTVTGNKLFLSSGGGYVEKYTNTKKLKKIVLDVSEKKSPSKTITSLMILKITTNNGETYLKRLLPKTNDLSFDIYNSSLSNTLQTPLNLKSGYFDDNMKEAVKIYQEVSGIKQTGELDRETMNKIFNDIKSKRCGTLQNINGFNISSEDQKKLLINDLKTMQGIVDSLNHPVAPPDTIYTPAQEDKIKDFWDHIKVLKVSTSDAVDTLREMDKLNRD